VDPVDALVETLRLPLDQAFAPDEGFGSSHGSDWLDWPVDDGTFLSPLDQEDNGMSCHAKPRPSLASTHVGIEALLPDAAPPLRYYTAQFFRLRGALLLGKCAASTAVHGIHGSWLQGADEPRPHGGSPAPADDDMVTEADLADSLSDLSEAQMVAFESPIDWLRRGEHERASRLKQHQDCTPWRHHLQQQG
jgi:hypothetical protein